MKTYELKKTSNTIIFVLVLSGLTLAQTMEWDCGATENSDDQVASTVTCTLDEEGVFTVSGTGAMMDYYPASSRPWHESINTIKSVIIETGVTSIGRLAFHGNINLADVAISNSVTSIGSHAFTGCNALTSITIPNSVESIGNTAFQSSGLTSITLGNGITSIGNNAFYSAELTSITIPSSVTSIGINAFVDCNNLVSINVEEGSSSYTSVDGVLFNYTQTNLIQYPAGKQDTVYSIPEGVVSIGANAFNLNRNNVLKSITFPSSVAQISLNLFSGGLSYVISLNPEPPEIIDIPTPFGGLHDICLYVPEESVAAYRFASEWSYVFECIQDLASAPNVSVRHSLTRNLTANQPQIFLRGRNLNVRVPQSSVESSHNVRVLDLRGRQIANFRMGETNTRTFSLARVPAGKYFVEIRNANTRIGSSSVIVR